MKFEPQQQIGYLTLLYKEKRVCSDKNKRTQWYCQCICGNTLWRLESYLKFYPNRKFSCGCMIFYGRGKLQNNKTWKGKGDLSGQNFAHIRSNAKRRNIAFDITIDEAWTQFIKQDKKCALTGRNIVISNNKNENTASLDRIDSTKPYTTTNIQWIYKPLNNMKLKLTQQEFIQLCSEVYKYSLKYMVKQQ